MKSETQSAFGRDAWNCLVDVIERASRRLVADRCSHRLATNYALQAEARHQPLDGAAGNRKAFSSQLTPDLARAVDAEVVLEHAPHLDLQGLIPLRSVGQPGGIEPLGNMVVVGRRGDWQHLADRLDPIRFP